MTDHSPEPWRAHLGPEAFYEYVAHSTGGGVLVNSASQHLGAFLHFHDLSRAVTCVNACAGLDPSAIPDLVAAGREADRAMRQMSIACEAITQDTPIDFEITRINLHAALARLEGGTP